MPRLLPLIVTFLVINSDKTVLYLYLLESRDREIEKKRTKTPIRVIKSTKEARRVNEAPFFLQREQLSNLTEKERG
jgi:hypothetical protein